jgi:hypothetical protein
MTLKVKLEKERLAKMRAENRARYEAEKLAEQKAASDQNSLFRQHMNYLKEEKTGPMEPPVVIKFTLPVEKEPEETEKEKVAHKEAVIDLFPQNLYYGIIDSVQEQQRELRKRFKIDEKLQDQLALDVLARVKDKAAKTPLGDAFKRKYDSP